MQVGNRSEADIRESAHEFLREYHPDNTIPVPIEEIIEFGLRLDIIPVHNLRQSHGIDGALSRDFSQIYVDEYVFNNWPNRHRFTLAHEIGHLVLHKSDLENDEVNTIDDWLIYAKTVASFGDWFETQAHIFARHLLMPTCHLESQFNNFLPDIERLVQDAKKGNIERLNYLDPAVYAMARMLSPVFEVSEDAARVRILTHKLHNLIP
jgi:Zn-dependent peptidase ImmA (M78 family)